MPVLPGGTVVDKKGKAVEAKDPGTVDKAIQGAEKAVTGAVAGAAKGVWGRVRPGRDSPSAVSAEDVDDEGDEGQEQGDGTAQPDKVVGQVDGVVQSRRSIPRPPTLTTRAEPNAAPVQTEQSVGLGQRLRGLLPTRQPKPQSRVQIGHDEHGFALRILGQDELFNRFRRGGFEITGTPAAFEVWGPQAGIPFGNRDEALTAFRQVKGGNR